MSDWIKGQFRKEYMGRFVYTDEHGEEHETGRQVSPGGAMTYTYMDDDTINELNAEVARQRDLWQQPDPDKHLEEADMRPLAVLLERLAVCVRVYEASKRRAARAHGSKPAVGSNPEEGSD